MITATKVKPTRRAVAGELYRVEYSLSGADISILQWPALKKDLELSFSNLSSIHVEDIRGETFIVQIHTVYIDFVQQKPGTVSNPFPSMLPYLHDSKMTNLTRQDFSLRYKGEFFPNTPAAAIQTATNTAKETGRKVGEIASNVASSYATFTKYLLPILAFAIVVFTIGYAANQLGISRR